jgi:hypothetical protein
MKGSLAALEVIKLRLAEMLQHLPPPGKWVVQPFPTPTGATWKDVSIRFVSDYQVQISMPDCSQPRNYVQMGFENSKTKKSDSAWVLLTALARTQGKLERPETLKGISQVEKSVQTLRKRLKSFFGMQEDPFEDFRKVKCYRTKFKVSFPDADRL